MQRLPDYAMNGNEGYNIRVLYACWISVDLYTTLARLVSHGMV